MYTPYILPFPSPVYSLFVTLATLAGIVALAFMLALFVPARKRFQDAGFEASLGNAVRPSLFSLTDNDLIMSD